jgi:polyamine oxidase
MRRVGLSAALLLTALADLTVVVVSVPITRSNDACKNTKVVILGAGMAGITAAQTLHNNSITDFIIVEYKADIGGRVTDTTFGEDLNGNPYVVELGANWVQGIASTGGSVNPIWSLALKYGLNNTYSNYSSIKSFNASGAADFLNLLDDYQNAYSKVEQEAGYSISGDMKDLSMRSGLSNAGWDPRKDMNAQAAEWWQFDWEYSYSPDQSSQQYAVVVSSRLFEI